MNAAVVALLVLSVFAIGYRFYSRFLSQKIFRLDADEPVPSRELYDGVDYVPTKKHVLWGHHYTSIAGAAPIVGPALAVIWGWVPAILWVTIGTVTMGAVHDFSALVISLRNKGRSIGDIAGVMISARARSLFLLIIAFLIWVVLAVFAYIIGTLFISYPASVFPINVQIIIALVLGWLVYKKGMSIFWPSIVGYGLLMMAVFYGESFAAAFPAITEIPVLTWVWILMVYSFAASVLPVWTLLQPRDYLNSHQLLTGLFLLLAGLLVLQPTIKAPAFNPSPAGAPPLLPFLFITIACGAISGFHGLVSSGTTSKQVNCMTDARPIGYGGMLGEGALGLMSVLATTAGFATAAEWYNHYSSWGEAQGLDLKLSAFVNGGGTFISSLGIPLHTAQTFVAVMVIAFAATSLDTGARIQRLIISELAGAYKIKPLTNRYAAATLAIGSALVLAVVGGPLKGGLALWPLFGTTNQLVAGITLLIASIWLKRAGRPFIYTLVPMIIVAVATCLAMVGEVYGHVTGGNWLLATSGVVILILDIWVLMEGLLVLYSTRKPDTGTATA